MTRSSNRPFILPLLVAVVGFSFGAWAATAQAATTLPQMSLGQANTCAWIPGGAASCWGGNDVAELGGGSGSLYQNILLPQPVGIVSNPSRLATGGENYGGEFTCAVMADTTVKCWGDGEHRQLGDDTYRGEYDFVATNPITVTGVTGAVEVTTGYYHGCALLSGGTVKCWGKFGAGQLGPSATNSLATDVGLTGVQQVSAAKSGNRSCAVLTGGTVKCWGAGGNGLIGDGGPIGDRPTPATVSGVSGATMVSVGSDQACALVTGGAVKCWGYDAWGSLGNGTGTAFVYGNASLAVSVTGISGATSIAAGDYFNCALMADRTVKCWGKNGKGQLGDGAGGVHWYDISNTPVTVSGLTGVAQIYTGGQHACAVLLTGDIKCWGKNDRGQIGDGTEDTDRTAPVAVSSLALEPPADPVLTGVPSGSTYATSATIGISSDAGATFSCSIDGGAFASCSSPLSLTGLAAGSHSVAVKATKGGLTSGTTTKSWTVSVSCTPGPTPPTPTGPVTVTSVSGRWVLNVGTHFNTGGDTRGCAQLLSVQISIAKTRPSNVAPIESKPSYRRGIVAWTGGDVSRASKFIPRWVRIGNRVGRWTRWVAVTQ